MAFSDFINNGSNNDIASNTYRSYSSSCRAKVYHYSTINPDPNATDDTVTKSEVIGLDNQNPNGNPIIGFNFTKSNSGCAGYFQLTLAPTENWKQRIKPGDWIEIYMSNGQDSGETLRCLGNIDTIGMSERVSSQTGARHITFTVSGRDWGKVLERYMIYINYFIASGAGTNELIHQLLITDVLGVMRGSPDEVVKNILKVFLGRGGSAGAFTDQTQLLQWYIPQELAKAFGANTGSESKFFDILSIDDGSIQNGLPGYKIITNPDVRTPLWTLMQEHANVDINELFAELYDVGGVLRPAVFLRTIPFTFKSYSDPTGSITDSLNYFLDLPVVKIKGDQILGSETRINEHDRFSFMVYLTDTLDAQSNSPVPSIALLNGQFPFISASACKRYGLTVFERTSDFQLIRNVGNSAQIDPNLLLAWNDLIKHWYTNNAYFEDATITIMGSPDVRLGKRLEISQSPLLAGNNDMTLNYYIEAYVDSWEYGGPWTQQLVLTRGIFVQNGKEKLSYEVYTNDNAFIGVSNYSRGGS